MYAVPASGLRPWRRLMVLCAVLAAAACADGAPTSAGTRTPEDATQLVARSLAGALADDAARLAVRDAMRASDVDGHRIVLQHYLASAQGAGLLAAASSAAGMEAAEFQQRSPCWTCTCPCASIAAPGGAMPAWR